MSLGFCPEYLIEITPIAAIFLWDLVCCLIFGVSPLGDQVLFTKGAIKIPASSTKTTVAFFLRAFFNASPLVANPLINFFLVFFDGFALWSLR